MKGARVWEEERMEVRMEGWLKLSEICADGQSGTENAGESERRKKGLQPRG